MASSYNSLNSCVFFFLTGAAGQNKQHVITKNTAKLDRETEELQHQRVPLEVGKVIQQGRQNKGLTQKDLATVSRTHLHTHTHTLKQTHTHTSTHSHLN